MSRVRSNGIAIAFERRLWRRIALVAGAILIGSVSSVPSASAMPGEVTDTVRSTVESVDATPNAAPSLPGSMPPAPPSPPVATPAPVRLQTEAPPPTSSASPSSSDVNVPSADGIASAVRNSVGSVTSTGRETTQQAAASARDDGSWVSTPPNGPGTQAQARLPSAARSAPASSSPPSITAAEVAALQRWFIRVWPAIALGGLGRGWAARVIGDLFRPAAATTARLPFLPPLASRAPSDSPFAGHPGAANAPQLALPNSPASADSRIIYRVVLAALLAFLAFTIWREFRSALRPGVR
jgi:hypothetical protein